jgi:citrate lyase gamma subunit
MNNDNDENLDFQSMDAIDVAEDDQADIQVNSVVHQSFQKKLTKMVKEGIKKAEEELGDLLDAQNQIS